MNNNKISIIVPVYQSAEILPHLLEAIDKEREKNNWNLELLLVDDSGDADNSFEVICQLKETYSYIRGFKLSRNFGQQSALHVGLTHSTGDYIAIIDDDLQDPPSILPLFFDQLDNGYDVAYGVRTNRKESFFKKMAYKYYYRILRFISEIQIPLDTGDFCAIKRKVVLSMLQLEERRPYIRGIRFWVGYKQIGVEYDRPERAMGESHMTLEKLFKFAADGIYSFSNLPLKLALFGGTLALIVAIFYSCFIAASYFLYGNSVQGFSTIVLLILFFGSINLLVLGIIGEYIARIYNESKNRPHAIIDTEI
jgi:glycosyltransferase involved in cell wall biosynthesis